MQISRKKRPLDRTSHPFRDTRLFIIATEGKNTEKQYFSIFRNSRIQVLVLETIDNKSAPEYVCNRLDDFIREYDLDDKDDLWLMLDVDRWGDKKLSKVTQLACQKEYFLAISNPCFEIWLYFHFKDSEFTEITCQELENYLKGILGSYNKSKLDLEKYKPYIDEAIERAKKYDLAPDGRWPQTIGSHVYKIVEKIV